MKVIERSTVRDLGNLFKDGGFHLTINPCTDMGAEEACQSVIAYARTLPHDGLLVVERSQSRGRTTIDRPHVHLAMRIGKEQAEIIADVFRRQGMNVRLDGIYDPRGLCWYLGKDSLGSFYRMNKEGRPHQERRPEKPKDKKGSTVCNAPQDHQAPSDQESSTVLKKSLYRLRRWWKHARWSVVFITTSLARAIRFSMTRAP
jgi:hypothetical protein